MGDGGIDEKYAESVSVRDVKGMGEGGMEGEQFRHQGQQAALSIMKATAVRAAALNTAAAVGKFLSRNAKFAAAKSLKSQHVK